MTYRFLVDAPDDVVAVPVQGIGPRPAVADAIRSTGAPLTASCAAAVLDHEEFVPARPHRTA